MSFFTAFVRTLILELSPPSLTPALQKALTSTMGGFIEDQVENALQWALTQDEWQKINTAFQDNPDHVGETFQAILKERPELQGVLAETIIQSCDDLQIITEVSEQIYYET